MPKVELEWLLSDAEKEVMPFLAITSEDDV